MKIIPVASSLLRAVGYDPDREELYVEFHKGGSYVYRGLPQSVFNTMMDENSVGSFVMKNIKGKYECVKEPIVPCMARRRG